MIAGGGGNDAAFSLFGGELRDEVDASANFEGSNGLIVFVLDVHVGTKQSIHGRIAM